MNPPVLRNYQHDAVEAVFREWETHGSTMIVMATGLGKTVTFCEIIRRIHPKRAIIIAHRSELIHQACAALARIGLDSEIEMADQKADASMFAKNTTIVASVQSLISGKKDNKRMLKFRPDDFDLLVIDEHHHSVSDSYKTVIDHFRKNKNLKVLGVTATPDRLDKKALGQVTDSVAFKYDILRGIDDGYLVDLDQQFLVASIDYSGVRTTAGDLNGADLAKVMEDEAAVQGMVGASIQVIGPKKSIAFTSSVRHAEMCCDIFNRHRPGMADWICGETPEDERARIMKRFKAGEVQVLANCGIATEGFDVPSVECIIMGRPTLSRALYTQMLGRGTRPLTGTIDGLNSAYERREAISESRKPACLVLDFIGNSGRHKLTLKTCVDILGGNYDDETKKIALEEAHASEQPVRITELLEKSKRQIQELIAQQKRDEEARKAKLVAKVQFVSKSVSPFDLFDITPKRDTGWDHGKELSLKQRAVLQKMGVDPDELGYTQSKQLLVENFKRREKQLCTFGQAKVLSKFGYDPKNVTFTEASDLITRIKEAGWKRPNELALA